MSGPPPQGWGVYAIHPETGAEILAHRYQGGDYYLTDVIEFFALGRIEAPPPDPVAAFDRPSLRRLKAEADAQSFDFDEPFIEMCLELARVAQTLPGDAVRFVERFPPAPADAAALPASQSPEPPR